MGAEQNFDWKAAAASGLDWWHDAGVDCATDDIARDWLALSTNPEPAAQASQNHSPAAAAATARAVPAAPLSLPETLDEFTAWRVCAAAPEAGWAGAKLGATGNSAAALMVIVDMPDREDFEQGVLLGGTAGRLFDRMMAAIGLNRESLYLVPMAVCRPPSGQLPAEAEPLLADILRRHIALARPRCLLVLGRAPSRAILGADVAQARGKLQFVNHDGGQCGAFASFHPRFLVERPTAKAEAWKDLQLLRRENVA
ncbi:MAG: uracil-DNA glycosylase [Sphingomonas sp.]|jgi:DNA polymerase